MGPISLFDKSFLQSLSLDESFWFDHFFLSNICPLLYAETLADLDKSVKNGRTPEQEVGVIADKFPEGGGPCAYHRGLCINELLGYSVPMTGQIPMTGGRRVRSAGGRAAVFERSPEAAALEHWQRREFLDIEHQYARDWRRGLEAFSVAQASDAVKTLGLDVESCKDLSIAEAEAAKLVSGQKKPFELINFALNLLGIPTALRQQLLKWWFNVGKPPLAKHAPFTAHVLKVEVFFQIALASKLISGRPSNRLDIAYLYYLPFCMIFISNDNLHRDCAPLLLRPGQEFVRGQDLKTNLGQINEHYLLLPESDREKGVYSFVDNYPPQIGNQMVYNLWTRHLPALTEGNKQISSGTESPSVSAEEIIQLADAPELSASESGWASGELDQIVIKRHIKKKRGSWYQVPKEAPETQDSQL